MLTVDLGTVGSYVLGLVMGTLLVLALMYQGRR